MATTDRIKAILEAEDRASSTFQTVQFAVADLADVALEAAAAVGRELVEALQSAVTAAAEYQSANTNLAVALANQGKNTKDTRDRFREFARELTDVSQATENQILAALAQATAMGASEEAAKKLIRASTDLAVFTGNQEQAFRQAIRTLGGYAGELGEVIPELKDLTQEQLRAGDAADIILQKFQGAGEAGANDFKGAVNNLRSALEQLRTSVGGPIIEVLTELNNTVLLPLLKTFRDAVGNTGTWRNIVVDTAIALVEFASAIEKATRELRSLAQVAFLLGALELERQLERLGQSAKVLGFLTGKEANPALQALLERLTKLRDEGPRVAEVVGNIGQAIGGPAGVNEAIKVTEQRFISFSEALRETIRFGNVFSGQMNTLGNEIRDSFSSVGVRAVDSFSNALADAALTGELNFKRFFNSLLKDIARAIAQALVLRAILGITGLFGGGGGAGGSSGGGFIPGIPFFGLSAGPGIPGIPGGGAITSALPVPTSGAINLSLSLDPGVVVKDMNDAVERGSVTLTATKLKQVRNVR